MMTKYGEVENKTVIKSLDLIIGKLFKIIHLKEENCKTIDTYVNSLCRKLTGASDTLFPENILIVVFILNGLDLRSHDLIRSDVFEAISIIDSIKKRCEDKC